LQHPLIPALYSLLYSIHLPPAFFQRHAPLRVLHSFPTRRSSDLVLGRGREQASLAVGLLRLAALHRQTRHQQREHREDRDGRERSEEHTSELQSPCNLVCRLLLEKKKKQHKSVVHHVYQAADHAP